MIFEKPREIQLELEEWTGPSDSARKSMPASAFLDTKNKKYPFKVKRDGKWVPSRSGLIAAKSRAAQQHKPALVKKADNLLARHFGKTKK